MQFVIGKGVFRHPPVQSGGSTSLICSERRHLFIVTVSEGNILVSILEKRVQFQEILCQGGEMPSETCAELTRTLLRA